MRRASTTSLKDANAEQTISFPDRQSFGGGVSLTYVRDILPWFSNWAQSSLGLIVGKRRAEGGERRQSAAGWLATSGLRCNLRTIEAWTRVLGQIQVHRTEIAADLYFVDWCDSTRRNIHSSYSDPVDFRGLDAHKSLRLQLLILN